MSPVLIKQIKDKIEQLEQFDQELHELKDFLWQVVYITPPKKELTEEDALKIIKQGEKEYREGKTIELESLLKLKYPRLANGYPKNSNNSNVRQKTAKPAN